MPAASGIQQLSALDRDQLLIISEEFDLLAKDFDIILFDTGAGISSNVTFFCAKAHDILVIATPEPTSLTDAYALIKVLFKIHNQKNFKIIVNSAKSKKEAEVVYINLCATTDRFLPFVSLEYMGDVLYDGNIIKSVRMQKSIIDCYPYSKASKGFFDLSEKITGWKPVEVSDFKL